jgi:Flp pilus assembly protein TadG
MTHPQPRSAPAARPALEDGQILVLTLVVGLGLLAILGLVADGGLLFARHRELQAIADAAARAGAGQLDEATYRASSGRTAQLDPTQAREAAARHLRAAGFTGQATITADTGWVTIGLAERIRTLIFNNVGFSPIQLAVHSRAEPRTGSTQPQGP